MIDPSWVKTLLNGYVDSENLLEIAKELVETGLWKLETAQLTAPSYLEDAQADLDLAGFLFWAQNQKIHLVIPSLKEKNPVLSQSCYATSQKEIGIRINSNSEFTPQVVPITNSIGLTLIGDYSPVFMEDSTLNLPYLTKYLNPAKHISKLEYTESTARALVGEHYSIMKITIALLQELESHLTEPNHSLPEQFPSRKTELKLLEFLEVALQYPLQDKPLVRKTWLRVYTKERAIFEVQQYLWKLSFLTTTVEQAYYEHFIVGKKAPPVTFQEELIGKTIWRTLRKSSSIKILTRKRKKLERVVKQDDHE